MDVDTAIPFYADDTCTGCGLCERVCPSGRVKLRAGQGAAEKPAWQADVQCYACYACFNLCPTQSIFNARGYFEKTGRYCYPGITADDIASQKQ